MWITYGTTESGDDLEVLLWDYQPTPRDVEDKYRKIYPDEYEEVGFVNFKIDFALNAKEF